MSINFAIITCSSTRSIKEDTAGLRLAELIKERHWKLVSHVLVKDDIQQIADAISKAASAHVDVILTCGGTGLSLKDVTPEATRKVCEREVCGIAEAMRAYSMTKTPRAMLSRALCMQIDHSLVINLPGSKIAAEQNFEAVANQLEHAVSMMAGHGHH